MPETKPRKTKTHDPRYAVLKVVAEDGWKLLTSEPVRASSRQKAIAVATADLTIRNGTFAVVPWAQWQVFNVSVETVTQTKAERV